MFNFWIYLGVFYKHSPENSPHFPLRVQFLPKMPATFVTGYSFSNCDKLSSDEELHAQKNNLCQWGSLNNVQYQNWNGLHIQKHLVLVLVLLSYKQLDIYLEKDFEIKDKPMIFRCLEKGEKSITSDDGTSICWPPEVHQKSWPCPSHIRSKHDSFLDCTVSAAIDDNWWFSFKINGQWFLQNFCPGHWFICKRNTYSSLSYASQSRPHLQLAGIHCIYSSYDLLNGGFDYHLSITQWFSSKLINFAFMVTFCTFTITNVVFILELAAQHLQTQDPHLYTWQHIPPTQYSLFKQERQFLYLFFLKFSHRKHKSSLTSSLLIQK